MTNSATKVCPKCHEEKDASEYHKNTRRPDGLYRICKACELARQKVDYRKHREKRLAYGRTRRECPEYRATQNARVLRINKKRLREDPAFRERNRITAKESSEKKRAAELGISVEEYIKIKPKPGRPKKK